MLDVRQEGPEQPGRRRASRRKVGSLYAWCLGEGVAVGGALYPKESKARKKPPVKNWQYRA